MFSKTYHYDCIKRTAQVVERNFSAIMNMEEKNQNEHIDIQKETLKPIIKAKSKKDKELQEQEVESTGGGMGAGGG